MTLQALEEAIRKLIIKRKQSHDNYAEQDRINTKLTKLYDLKWVMKSQINKQKEN